MKNVGLLRVPCQTSSQTKVAIMCEPRKQNTVSSADNASSTAESETSDFVVETWLQDEVAPAYDAHKADPSRAHSLDKGMANVRAGISKSGDIAKFKALWVEGKASGPATELDVDSALDEARKELMALKNHDRNL